MRIKFSSDAWIFNVFLIFIDSLNNEHENHFLQYWLVLASYSSVCYSWDFSLRQHGPFNLDTKLRWVLWLRKLTSSIKAEFLQIALVLRIGTWKNICYNGGKKWYFLSLFWTWNFFYSAELFDCGFNFKFCMDILYL